MTSADALQISFMLVALVLLTTAFFVNYQYL